MSQLVDAHTHQYIEGASHTQVYIIPNKTIRANQIDNLSIYSCIGLHPWDILSESENTEFLNAIELRVQRKAIFAIGEIGLDKAISTDFSLQTSLFKAQIELACKYKVPRLIIHSVRAYNEVMLILIDSNYKGKVLFHDFSGPKELVEQLVNKVDCYFSFGIRLLNSQSKSRQTLKNINRNLILLETDDQSQITIDDVYTEASKICGTLKKNFILEVANNFKLFSV